MWVMMVAMVMWGNDVDGDVGNEVDGNVGNDGEGDGNVG